MGAEKRWNPTISQVGVPIGVVSMLWAAAPPIPPIEARPSRHRADASGHFQKLLSLLVFMTPPPADGACPPSSRRAEPGTPGQPWRCSQAHPDPAPNPPG